MSLYSDDPEFRSFIDAQLKEFKKYMSVKYKKAIDKCQKNIEKSVAKFIREESKKMGYSTKEEK